MITLADIPLTLDIDGEVQKWLDSYLPLDEMQDQAGSVSLRTNRPQTQSGNVPGVGLTLPNYPEPPKPKLNSLYWPTGASRWARGYYLAHQSQLTPILQNASTNNTYLTLVLSDEINSLSITAKVYLLQPRPLSAAWPGAPVNVDGLFLLPVVDERYFWQFRNSGTLAVTNTTQWEDVYSTLQSQLGVTIAVDSIPGQYQQPDIQELSRKYENAAVLLDAVAHSCGQRIVRQPDGTVSAVNTTTSNVAQTLNLSAGWLMMGGASDGLNSPSITPESVLVTFQKWRECAVDPTGDKYTVSKNAPGESQTGTVKVIHSTAFADFTLKSMVADNASDCDALATQISTDYYAWLAHQHDFSFVSIQPWKLTGFDDHAEWCFGRSCTDVLENNYQAYTRVQSRPYNFGDEEQLQQFEGMPVYPRLARVSLTANLATGGNANAKFVSDTTSGTTVTTDTLKVYDSESKTSAASGAILWAEYKSDTLRWEVVAGFNLIWSSTLTGSDVADLAVGTFTISDGRALSATNISGSTIHTGDSATVFEDLVLGAFFAMKAGTGASLVRFELTADLVYGTDPGSANALVVAFAAGSYAAGGSPITVYDFTRFSGYGSFSGKYNASITPKGYQGWAILKPDSTRYEVVWMEQKAQLISFRLPAKLKTSDSHQDNVVVTAFWNGRDPDPSAAGVTIYNLATDYPGIYKYSADANALGYAAWNEKIGYYKMIAVEGDGRRWQLWVNDDAGTCPANGVFVDNDAATDANSHTNTRNLIEGFQCNTTFHAGFWINGDTDVLTGAVGLCCTGESPVEALLSTSGAANDDIWGPSPGSWNLVKGNPGCRIIGTTTSATLALVQIEPINKVLVKIQASSGVADGASTTTYTIMTGATAGSESDAGYTTLPPLWNRTGRKVLQNEFAIAHKINTTWELAPSKSSSGIQVGTLHVALTNGASSVAIDGVTGCSTATNDCGLSGGAGNACFVAQKSDGTWMILQVLHIAATVVIDSLIVASTMKLQKNSRDFSVMPNAAATGATDIDTGQSC
jgi:hypothetical protein